jgi:hypothetical protein
MKSDVYSTNIIEGSLVGRKDDLKNEKTQTTYKQKLFFMSLLMYYLLLFSYQSYQQSMSSNTKENVLND